MYLQDEVFTKIVSLEEESSVFGADLHCHKTCIKGSSSYLAIFCDIIILIGLHEYKIFKVCYDLGFVLEKTYQDQSF